MKMRKFIRILSHSVKHKLAYKHLFHMLPIRNGLKQGDTLSPLLQNMPLRRSRKTT
jgi:hypothetical protein